MIVKCIGYRTTARAMHDELYSDAVRDIFIIRWYIFIKFYLAISSRSPSPWMSCTDRSLVFNREWPLKKEKEKKKRKESVTITTTTMMTISIRTTQNYNDRQITRNSFSIKFERFTMIDDARQTNVWKRQKIHTNVRSDRCPSWLFVSRSLREDC